MHRKKLLKILTRLLLPWIFWLSLIVSLTIGASLKADVTWISNLNPFLSSVIVDARNSAFILLPLSTVFVALCNAAKNKIEPTAVEVAVKGLLDDFRSAAFPEDDSDIDHRVTLFKFKYWNWSNIFIGRLPFGGWLVPYERSGVFTLRSRARFKVLKDKPENAEGFAGMVFTSGNCEYLSGLPDLKRSSSETNKKRYAKQTAVTEEFISQKLEKGGTFPRSLWGIPVEVNGERWGAIVVDSKHSELSGKEDLKGHYRHIGICLNNLLKTGG